MQGQATPVQIAALLVWAFAGWEVGTHIAGEFRDPRRAVPVYSLYSEVREPTAEMLNGVDVVVIDSVQQPTGN